MALALVLVGGVATGQQQQQSTSSAQASTATDKSSSDVTIQSSTQKAAFTNGSGANFLGVKVTDHGNLLSFESPAGNEAAIGNGIAREGYSLCSLDGNTVHGYDQGNVELGFGTPTFAQPNGAGTFPLTVTRNTTDGKLQLKQVWAKPDAIEKDVTVTMTVKNISSSTINGVRLGRGGDFDIGNSTFDRGALTDDSAFQWDDRISGPDTTNSFGMQLTALTFATPHGPDIDSRAQWSDRGQRCDDFTQVTPVTDSDLAMRVFYGLGNLTAGQSKSVKFEYGRF